MLWRKGHYGGRSETAARNDAGYSFLPMATLAGCKGPGARANDFGDGVQRACGRMS